VAAVVSTIASSSSVVFVAVDDAGVLIACCQLDRHEGLSHFGLFAVRPGLQGSGVGREMLDYAERYARDTFRAAAMEMTVIAQRTELIAWYERRGYQRTGQTRPFPYGDERFGVPRRDDLHFVVLSKLIPDG
jgi:GNAT superfamily N-acetyltransferase